MAGVKKLKYKKKYRVNINRKRLRNKLKKLPDINCKQIKEAWEIKKSLRTNLKEMGLAYNVNEVIQVPNVKREMIDDAKRKFTDDKNSDDNEISDHEVEIINSIPIKNYVAETLEAEAKAPREHLFRLPKEQVRFLTYLMQKYGEDYKAMSKDKKNYYQLTWKQIRAKIKVFKGIPQQYNEFLQSNSAQ